ncbi:MAG: hypothetical protein IPN19_09600 [Elusimicrobia bacterium]|nr:hypothetical protein [Elusimicrobiota bacterium]
MKVGRTSKAEMDRCEAVALEKALMSFLHTYDKDHRFQGVGCLWNAPDLAGMLTNGRTIS